MNRLTRYLASGVISLACLIPTHVLAQENGPCSQARFSQDSAQLYRAVSAISAEKGSDVLVYCDEEQYKFDAAGKSVHTIYVVYKILTQKGSEGWDEISRQWEPWHEEKPTLRARVISENSVHVLDPKTISDSPANDGEDEVYTDKRVVRAPLPAIALGVVVEEEVESRENAVVFAAGTVNSGYFGRTVPVQESRLVLEYPETLFVQFRTRLLPNLKTDRTISGGVVQIRFTQGPMAAMEKQESYLPADETAYPQITFSTGKAWQEVAKQYGEIVDKQIAAEDLKSVVSAATQGKALRDEKIKAIVGYLSREIRYTGIEFDEAKIVPHSPLETLKQKYGDCKDKSTLLVAMLRSAGIPAYVALLNAGDREEIDADLPGMGEFDHAIVFVPGTPEYWIDATDEYARLGQLPEADQGRLALIANAETSSLRKTPEGTSEENTIVEKREFVLAENGPATVTETTIPRGIFESEFRSYYVDIENKDTRENLTDYVKREYLADNLDKVERSDSKNLSSPFTLTLETKKAKRGATDLDAAVAAIRPEGLFNRLPSELQEREQPEKKDDQDGAKQKKPRTADYQLPEAYSIEWQYTITPPIGFQPKPLPPAKKTSLGPALLTYEFSTDKDGTVHAVLRFDTKKRRFTVSEATELRTKVQEISEGEAILIYFEPTSQALLNQGKVMEAVGEIRGLIAAHPKEALHHLQMGRLMLKAGQGEAAREEVRLATKLEPNSALAQKTAAEIYCYDSVGRKFRMGSDYTDAEAAYRRAEKLDPADTELKGNLAILLEYNAEGERYGPGAKLKEALAEYAKLKEEDLAHIGLKNNPAYAMFYAGEMSEAKAEGEKVNPQLHSLIVAAEAITNGPLAGMAEARRRTENEEGLKSVLNVAGNMALRLRNYKVAADLLEAGASGKNASNTIAFASMVRQTERREDRKYGEDPSGQALKMMATTFDPGMTKEKIMAMSSKNAQLVMQRQTDAEFKKTLQLAREVRTTFQRMDLPVDAMIDVVLSRIETKAEGNDSDGYRVTLRVPGAKTTTVYFVKEEGKYKILDSGEKPNAIALEMLDRLKAGNASGTRVLLDWIREGQTIAGGDDPLAGYAFPRMWTKGQDSDGAKMKLATASLLAETKETANEGVKILEESLGTATDEGTKTNIEASLILGYQNLEQYEKMWNLARELGRKYPESKSVFQSQESALRNMGKIAEADELARSMLRKNQDDLEAMRALVFNSQAKSDYEAARSRGLDIEKTGKAEGSDLNGIAWNSLFTGKTDATDLEFARKATQMLQNSPGIMHTLGCVYAAAGKTQEAREVLIQAMDALSLDEPNDDYWYAFGRIAEQYGLTDVAIADYKRIEKPAEMPQISSSSWLLAQNRLTALGSGGTKSHK